MKLPAESGRGLRQRDPVCGWAQYQKNPKAALIVSISWLFKNHFRTIAE